MTNFPNDWPEDDSQNSIKHWRVLLETFISEIGPFPDEPLKKLRVESAVLLAKPDPDWNVKDFETAMRLSDAMQMAKQDQRASRRKAKRKG